MKRLSAKSGVFRRLCGLPLCALFLLSFWVCPPSAEATPFMSSSYSSVSGTVYTYSDPTTTTSAVPRVVTLAADRVLVIFSNLELEVATDVPNRQGSAGEEAPSYMVEKFKFSGGAKVEHVLPHTALFDGVRPPFTAFEIVTDREVTVGETLSYSPTFQTSKAETFVLGVPLQLKLLGAFNATIQNATTDRLLDIELSDNLDGTDNGVVLGNGNRLPDDPFACFEAVLPENILTTTVTLGLSAGAQWSVKADNEQTTLNNQNKKEMLLIPGLNRLNITVGSGNSAIPYSLLIKRNSSPEFPELKKLNVFLPSAQPGGTPVVAITPESGQLAYYANVHTSIGTVALSPEADTGVDIEVNGQTVQSGGRSNPLTLQVGSNTIPIKLTKTLGDGKKTSVLYHLELSRGNDAYITKLELHMIDKDGQLHKIPLRHMNSETASGFVQTGATDNDGWQQYFADVRSFPNIHAARFFIEASYNDGTSAYVSKQKHTVPVPDNLMTHYRSKEFLITHTGENMGLYFTAFRKRMIGNVVTDTDDLCSPKVAVNIMSTEVEPTLTLFQITDAETGELVLRLEGSELDATDQAILSLPNSRRVQIHAECLNQADIVMRNDYGLKVYDNIMVGRVDFRGHGDERKVKVSVTNNFSKKEKTYNFIITQGYDGDPYIVLGMTPEQVMSEYNPWGLKLDINAKVIEQMKFDKDKQRWVTERTPDGKIPEMPSAKEDKDRAVFTMDVPWTAFPPLESAAGTAREINLSLRDAKYGSLNVNAAENNWEMDRQDNVTNEAGTGGTVRLRLDLTGPSTTKRRIYNDNTHQVFSVVGLHGELRDKENSRTLAKQFGEFAKVYDLPHLPFEEIEITLQEKKEVIIKHDKYPDEKKLPIINFKLWGGNWDGNLTAEAIGLQIGNPYTIVVAPCEVTTYGQYKELVRNNPEIGEKYPYVLERGSTISVQEELERLQNYGNFSWNMMDSVPLDFSHDPITITLEMNWGLNPYDYVDFNAEKRTITPKKEVPKGDAHKAPYIYVRAKTERLGLERVALITIIPANATEAVRESTVSFTSISPRLVYFGFKGAYKLNDDYDGYDVTNTPMMEIFNLKKSPAIGTLTYSNVAIDTLEARGTSDLMFQFRDNGLVSIIDEHNRLVKWVNDRVSGANDFGFLIRRFHPYETQSVLDTLESMLSGFPEHPLQRVSKWVNLLKSWTIQTANLTGPYSMKIHGKSSIGALWQLPVNAITVICSDPNEDEEDKMSSKGLADFPLRAAADDEAAGDSELDLSDYTYYAAASSDAFLLQEDSTAFSMEVILGEESEIADNRGGGSRAATADNVEWVVPMVPFARNMLVFDSDGRPISSDYSLFMDEVTKTDRTASSRGTSGGAPTGTLLLEFNASDGDVTDMEIFDFYVKMKGDNTVYSAKPKGSGENGGVRLHSYYVKKDAEKQQFDSSGSGCTVGGTAFWALAAAAFGWAIRRKK